jgi:hypothetical protein
LVGSRVIGLEAFDGAVSVETQGLCVGADVADGEGARRQEVEAQVLDGRQVALPDARGLGHFLERKLVRLTNGLQRLADVLARLQRRRGRAGRHGVQLVGCARIERHGHSHPRPGVL